MPGQEYPLLTRLQATRMETALRSIRNEELAEMLWKLRRRQDVADPPRERVCAMAERMPFEDASFDIALLLGSLPYIRIENALREVARVLWPGGRAIAIHSDLWQTLVIRARQRRWNLLSPGVLLREVRASTGMVLYPWFGRLFLAPSAPVQSTRRRTRRWLARAGLRVNSQESCRIAHEFCFVAEKAAGVEQR